jgi:hypothetical protein
MNMDVVIDDIKDSSLECVRENKYHLGVFGCGYEERCVHLATMLNPKAFDEVLVIGFREHIESKQRIDNRRILLEHFDTSEVLANSNDDSDIYLALRNSLFASSVKANAYLKVFVDYSSMSRMWYAAILNFLRFVPFEQKVSIDFAYTVGEHQDYTLDDSELNHEIVVKEVICVPGFEGASVRQYRTLAGLGIGFEWEKSLAALELLEPDEVFAFIAQPGAFESYAVISRQRHREFINDYIRRDFLEIPLRSVETAYKRIAVQVVPSLGLTNIALVPMGVKPHILASILLCFRFPQISLLHTVSHRRRPERVRAAADEDIVVTSVELVRISSQ